MSLIRTAFADANQEAPGQNFGGPHKNPSDGFPPSGHYYNGNSGQCQKLFDDRDLCFPK
jgi:hypothetical protein